MNTGTDERRPLRMVYDPDSFRFCERHDPDYFRFCELVFADRPPGDGGTLFPKGAVKLGFAPLPADTAENRQLYILHHQRLLQDYPRMVGVLSRMAVGGTTGNLVDEVEQATGLKGYALTQEGNTLSPSKNIWRAARSIPSRKPLPEASVDF